MYGKFYLLKAFILEEIYLRKLPKFFRDVCRDKKMDLSTNTDESSKNKNWRENNCERKTLKVEAIKTETKSEEVDDSKSVLSDLTFTFGSASDRVQEQPMSDTKSISENTTTKGILAAKGAQMQVSDTETPSAIDTITIEITKSQVAMLSKKGATIIDQGGNSYSMNALTLSNRMFHEYGVNGYYKNKINEDINPPC